MIPLKILGGLVASAAVAAVGAGLVSQTVQAKPDARPAAPPVSDVAPPQGEPLPPAPFVRDVRPRVPPGILARAADARALERGPSCPPPEPSGREACAREEREAIEIDWHVAKDP